MACYYVYQPAQTHSAQRERARGKHCLLWFPIDQFAKIYAGRLCCYRARGQKCYVCFARNFVSDNLVSGRRTREVQQLETKCAFVGKQKGRTQRKHYRCCPCTYASDGNHAANTRISHRAENAYGSNAFLIGNKTKLITYPLRGFIGSSSQGLCLCETVVNAVWLLR